MSKCLNTVCSVQEHDAQLPGNYPYVQSDIYLVIYKYKQWFSSSSRLQRFSKFWAHHLKWNPLIHTSCFNVVNSCVCGRFSRTAKSLALRCSSIGSETNSFCLVCTTFEQKCFECWEIIFCWVLWGFNVVSFTLVGWTGENRYSQMPLIYKNKNTTMLSKQTVRGFILLFYFFNIGHISDVKRKIHLYLIYQIFIQECIWLESCFT